MTRRRLTIVAAAWLLASVAAGQAQDQAISHSQAELLELVSILQIASVACSYEVDTKLLGLALRQEGLTLNSEPEKKLVATAMADARARFSGQKRGVECLSILDEYGPQGTRIQSLLRRR